MRAAGQEPANKGESSPRISSFSEFWPFYLSQHAKPATRLWHCFGTLTGLVIFGAALALQSLWLVPAALVAGYAFAWISHFFIEKNRPATFRYPLYSFVADFKMAFLLLTRRL